LISVFSSCLLFPDAILKSKQVGITPSRRIGIGNQYQACADRDYFKYKSVLLMHRGYYADFFPLRS